MPQYSIVKISLLWKVMLGCGLYAISYGIKVLSAPAAFSWLTTYRLPLPLPKDVPGRRGCGGSFDMPLLYLLFRG